MNGYHKVSDSSDLRSALFVLKSQKNHKPIPVVNKTFNNKEANKKSNVHFLHIANSGKPVAFCSLDVILAIEYRSCKIVPWKLFYI